MPSPATMLAELETLRDRFGRGVGERKLALIERLGASRLPAASAVRRFHDCLCFLRACPDDARLLAEVERLLGAFASRPDLARFRSDLESSGIAGTAIRFPFFHEMARWLASRWPGALTVDWRAHEAVAALEALYPAMLHAAEIPALEEYTQAPKYWMKLMKGPRETDAEFLVRRVGALRVDPPVRDALWASIDLPFVLSPLPGSPSRTLARRSRSPVHFQVAPLERGRPDIPREIARPPRVGPRLSRAEGEGILDLARGAMAVRQRDLDAFAHGNPDDVRMIVLDDGLELACIGLLPERRYLLETVHGFLTLRSGVPIGYVLTRALFGSCEVAYNVFETWRGTESARVYGRILAMAAHLFGADTFSVDTYQLGHQNEEGLSSGAWWFYQKLGFRPKDAAAVALMEREFAAMREDPSHRSDRATLRRLVQSHVFFHAGAAREDVLGRLSMADVGVKAMRYLAGRFGSAREEARRRCASEAARALGVRGLSRWTGDERRAFSDWAPLVLILPGLEAWRAAERRALAEVIRAKGGRDELAFVRRFDAHAPLRAALVELQRERL